MKSTGSAGTLDPAYLKFLLTELEIPEYLTNRTVDNLGYAYQKYLGFLDAEQKLDERIAARTWIGKRPAKNDLINIFTSRTMWFAHYKPFYKLNEYPILAAWLKGGPDAPTNLETWGVEQSAYSFKDMASLMRNTGKADQGKGKGKMREIEEVRVKEKKKGGDKEGKSKKKKARKSK